MSGDPEGGDDRKRGNERDHTGSGEGVDKTRRSGDQTSGPIHTGNEVGRDELAQADYGGTERGPAPDADAPHEGGVSDSTVESEGRKPTAERDRDYDPDGDRTGR